MEAIDKLRELSKKLEDPYFIKEFEEGFEKFLKERDMKIYHVETQQDYDALMSELEAEGYKWVDGEMPTEQSYFDNYGSETVIIVGVYDFVKVIQYGNIENRLDEQIIEYKAKGKDEMTKKCEKCDVEYHNNAKYCSMCGNRLVAEPEFKYGDIVASRIFRDASFSLVRLNEDLTNRLTSVDGFWYTKDDYAIGDMSLEVFKEDTRHATPEEIAEYEVALTFHKHGRKPFEVKKDDILLEDGNYKFFVDDPENWGEEDFVSGGYTFAKTAEEVDEWIKGENE